MVTRTEFVSKWKTHLVFGVGLVAAITFNVAANMVAGQHLSDAAWSAVRELRPLEVLMYLLFWYAIAFYRLKDEWSSSLTSLNLGSKDDGPR